MFKTGLGLTLALFASACAMDSVSDQPEVSQIERTASGRPYFMAGGLGQLATDSVRAGAVADVPAIRAQVGLTTGSELRIKTVETDAIGMSHVRVNHYKNGRRVVSGDAVLHLDSTGEIRSVDTGLVDRDLPSTPTLDAAGATEIAVQASTGTVSSVEDAELVYVVSNKDGELYLAWEVRLNGSADGVPMSDLMYVDALGDRVVDRHPRIFTAKTRTIRNGNNGAFPVAGAAVSMPMAPSRAMMPCSVSSASMRRAQSSTSAGVACRLTATRAQAVSSRLTDLSGSWRAGM